MEYKSFCPLAAALDVKLKEATAIVSGFNEAGFLPEWEQLLALAAVIDFMYDAGLLYSDIYDSLSADLDVIFEALEIQN